MARNPDPKPGRWILPLVILGMVFFTWAFVQQLEAPTLADGEPVSTTTSTDAPTPTTLPEEAPTTTLLAPDLQTYVDNLNSDKDALAAVESKMDAVNADWDDRAETGLTYEETEADLVAVAESALVFFQSVQLHIPPQGITGLGDAHETALNAAGEVVTSTDAVLDGLRAPDTGQQRQAALVEFRSRVSQFNLAVDTIDSIIRPTG